MPILGGILLVYIFLPWYWSNAHWISKDLIFRKWNANHSKHSTYSKCHTLCGGKLQVGNMPSEYTRIFCWCCYYKTTKKVHLQSKERIWCYNAIIQPFVNNKKIIGKILFFTFQRCPRVFTMSRKWKILTQIMFLKLGPEIWTFWYEEINLLRSLIIDFLNFALMQWNPIVSLFSL